MMRYETSSLGWFLHDLLIHPITGLIGILGRVFRSYRLMALAHHIHNVSAPSNDVMADYVEAMKRACDNENGESNFKRVMIRRGLDAFDQVLSSSEISEIKDLLKAWGYL